MNIWCDTKHFNFILSIHRILFCYFYLLLLDDRYIWNLTGIAK